MGSLSDIVESTLIDDVSPPSVIQKTDWIKPGLVSWNYWSNNHGTKDYKVVCEFADLAASMNWPYTLLDWEWDVMGNGGTLEDAVEIFRGKRCEASVVVQRWCPSVDCGNSPRSNADP